MSMRSWMARSAGSALREVVMVGSCVRYWREGESADLGPDALEHGEVVKRGLAEVAAVAGLLDAAVRDGRVDHLVGVDPHRPDAQRSARAVCDVDVFRPH